MEKINQSPESKLYRRMWANLLISGSFILISLMIGVLGYHFIAGLDYMDSLLNASMILTGMGPVNQMATNDAKLFASLYALFSGVAFLTCIAVLSAPILHMFMHRFHLDDKE